MRFAGLDDEAWFARLVQSQHDRTLGLPGFPPDAVQAGFVGQAGETALQHGFDFYKGVRREAGPSISDCDILDFGVGWGRVIRMFLRDTSPDRLYGVDVDAGALKLCADTGVPGALSQISPQGPLPFHDGKFGVCYAFSVFSHISTASAETFLAELIRVTKPGGIVYFTTMGQGFLDLCWACTAKHRSERTPFEQMYSETFSAPGAALEKFKAGQHVFAPTGGIAEVLEGSTYGWAAMPRAWLERQIEGRAEITYHDPGSILEQATFCLTVK
ncbi:class I SAM-dependent methyltransferase [Methylobacterium oryzisoli]|uniref:class I SAM-dependent methyltransferase n=1 Tax=Methylobacterium oryzisoli TaxID=3385502 RepID=UPI003891D474